MSQFPHLGEPDPSSGGATAAPSCEHGYSTRDVGGIPIHIGTGKLCGGAVTDVQRKNDGGVLAAEREGAA